MSHTILLDHGKRRISYQLVRSLSSRIFLYSGDFATSEQSAIFTIGKGVGLKRNVRIRFALSNVLADLRHDVVGAFRYLAVPQIRTCVSRPISLRATDRKCATNHLILQLFVYNTKNDRRVNDHVIVSLTRSQHVEVVIAQQHRLEINDEMHRLVR